MIDFVGTPSFLRIPLWVAMETMHFHMAQTGLSFRNILFSFSFRCPGSNLSPMKNCSRVQGRSN